MEAIEGYLYHHTLHKNPILTILVPVCGDMVNNGKRGRDTKIPQSGGPPIKVGDEAIHKELGDRMKRAATTASSFEAAQDSGSGPRCQDTILGDVDFQTRFETTSIQSNDPPLSKVKTFGGGEDILKLMELMAHCIKLCEFMRKKNKEKCAARHIFILLSDVNTVSMVVKILILILGSYDFTILQSKNDPDPT
ncbi:hypothetical protein Tco_1381589 [Tanacetum coccineum]